MSDPLAMRSAGFRRSRARAEHASPPPCRATADTLSTESGFTLESRAVTEFRDGVLQGNWAAVETLLLELPQDQVTDSTVRAACCRRCAARC